MRLPRPDAIYIDVSCVPGHRAEQKCNRGQPTSATECRLSWFTLKRMTYHDTLTAVMRSQALLERMEWRATKSVEQMERSRGLVVAAVETLDRFARVRRYAHGRFAALSDPSFSGDSEQAPGE